MPTKPIPDGFHVITPYLFVEGAPRLIEFISAAFGGKVTYRAERPDGSIMHATMRVGDSMLMLADASAQFKSMPTSIYLYVTDSDAVYQTALNSGGISVFPIMTLPSGERYGGGKGPYGNTLGGATHLDEPPPGEEERHPQALATPRGGGGFGRPRLIDVWRRPLAPARPPDVLT